VDLADEADVAVAVRETRVAEGTGALKIAEVTTIAEVAKATEVSDTAQDGESAGAGRAEGTAETAAIAEATKVAEPEKLAAEKKLVEASDVAEHANLAKAAEVLEATGMIETDSSPHVVDEMDSDMHDISRAEWAQEGILRWIVMLYQSSGRALGGLWRKLVRFMSGR